MSLQPIRNIAVLPWWTCDVACHHCLFHSSPRIRGSLDIQAAANFISQVHERHPVETITVSGGEAFLNPGYLHDLARLCATLGLRFRVVTNCNFATSENVANEVLKLLQAVRLDAIGVSWDKYHQAYIDPNRVRNLIRAAQHLNILVQMTVVVSKTSNIAEALDALDEEAFEIPVVQVKCLPVGRAKTKVKNVDLLTPDSKNVGRACRNDFDTITIDPNGVVYPCCAVGGFTEGIAIGNVHEDTVKDILGRRDQGFKWIALASRGPRYFLDFCTPEEATKLDVRDCDHDCVTCNKIFSGDIGQSLVQRAIENVAAKSAKIVTAWERDVD